MTHRPRAISHFFSDPIGTPPSALGKRNIEAHRELGMAAAAAMKYVPIPDGEPMPKRGRGCGCGESGGPVVFPRGNSVSNVDEMLC